MSVAERDKYSGHMTTGHEWNDIKELNTPVPRVLYLFYFAAFVFAIGYWIMMPAWPLGDTFTRGKLNFDQRDWLEKEVFDAIAARSEWNDKLEALDFESIQADPELMKIVGENGPALFGDNCAMCHGLQGQGNVNYPRLNDDKWLWGDKPEDILHTLNVGINSAHPESRIAQMPALGETGALDGVAIADVALYVKSLSEPWIGGGTNVDDLLSVSRGKAVYATNCIACHGAEGHGNQMLGAPDLTDDFWIYGNDIGTLKTTISAGRSGHMPYWDSRLTLAERKLLTLYVLSLSEQAKTTVAAESSAGES